MIKVYKRYVTVVYSVHRAFIRRARDRLVSRESVAAVIWADSLERAFSNEAGEDVSAYDDQLRAWLGALHLGVRALEVV